MQYTKHLNLNKVDYGTQEWHKYLNDNFEIIDEVIAESNNNTTVINSVEPTTHKFGRVWVDKVSQDGKVIKGKYKIDNGTDYNEMHFETESELVKFKDGKNINEKLTEYNQQITSKYNELISEPRVSKINGKTGEVVLTTEDIKDKKGQTIDKLVTEGTNELKNKINNIKIPVQSVNSKTGDVVLTTKDIKRGNGNNLDKDINDMVSDMNKFDKNLAGLSQQVTTQYEDCVKQLKENATKTIARETNVISLDNSVDGIANIEIGGNTLYKNKDDSYTNTFEKNCTLESVGELGKNKIEVKSVGKNLIDINKFEDISILNNTFKASMWASAILTKEKMINIFEPNTKYYIKAKYTLKSVSTLPLYQHLVGFNLHNYKTKTSIDIGCTNNLKKVGDIVEIDSDFTTPSNWSDLNQCQLLFYTNRYTKESNIETDTVLVENLVISKTPIKKYEPYVEYKVSYTLKEPLRSLPNSTRDTINGDGTITRKIGRVVLNGCEDWCIALNSDNTREHFYTQPENKNGKKGANQVLMCDNFVAVTSSWTTSKLNTVSTSNSNCFQIGFTFSKDTYTIDTWKQYLKKNPATVLYELKEPITEKIGEPLTLKTFGNGSIQVDTTVLPYLQVGYPTNINSRIGSVENVTNIIKSNLGGAWQTLLILADKELKMKSIKLLSTNTNDDLKNKINEILGAW